MFCPRYTPPDKTNLHYIPPCAAELYEVFDRMKSAGACSCGSFVLAKDLIVFLLALDVRAERVEGLLAHVVLHAAGILKRGLFVHAEGYQEAGKHPVPLQHTGRDLHAALAERDEAVLIHGNIAVFAQALGRIGDAGLGDAQLLGNVDGADIAMLLLHHQHRLEIILRSSQNFHGILHHPFLEITLTLTHSYQKCKKE